jgi:hypothetical protein
MTRIQPELPDPFHLDEFNQQTAVTQGDVLTIGRVTGIQDKRPAQRSADISTSAKPRMTQAPRTAKIIAIANDTKHSAA